MFAFMQPTFMCYCLSLVSYKVITKLMKILIKIMFVFYYNYLYFIKTIMIMTSLIL